jgi:hypothetical protein
MSTHRIAALEAENRKLRAQVGGLARKLKAMKRKHQQQDELLGLYRQLHPLDTGSMARDCRSGLSPTYTSSPGDPSLEAQWAAEDAEFEARWNALMEESRQSHEEAQALIEEMRKACATREGAP